MATFGQHEVVRELYSGSSAVISAARPRGGRGAAGRAVKALVVQPPPDLGPRPTDRDADRTTDRAIDGFLESAELQQRVAARSKQWATVHEVGATPDQPFYVTDLYPRSVQRLIKGRVSVGGAGLHRIVSSVLRGLCALRQAAGRPHGNLKPSNVLLSGRGAVRSARVWLADPAPDGADLSEAADLRAVGDLIHQLVTHARPGPASWPAAASPAWAKLGRRADGWRELYNRLADPLATDPPTLAQVVADVRRLREPFAVAADRRRVAACAAVVTVALAVAALVAWQRRNARAWAAYEQADRAWLGSLREALTEPASRQRDWRKNFEDPDSGQSDPYVAGLIGYGRDRARDLVAPARIERDALLGPTLSPRAMQRVRRASGVGAELARQLDEWPLLCEFRGASRYLRDQGLTVAAEHVGRFVEDVTERRPAARGGRMPVADAMKELRRCCGAEVDVLARLTAVRAAWARVLDLQGRLDRSGDGVLKTYRAEVAARANAAFPRSQLPATAGRLRDEVQRLQDTLAEAVQTGNELAALLGPDELGNFSPYKRNAFDKTESHRRDRTATKDNLLQWRLDYYAVKAEKGSAPAASTADPRKALDRARLAGFAAALRALRDEYQQALPVTDAEQDELNAPVADYMVVLGQLERQCAAVQGSVADLDTLNFENPGQQARVLNGLKEVEYAALRIDTRLSDARDALEQLRQVRKQSARGSPAEDLTKLLDRERGRRVSVVAVIQDEWQAQVRRAAAAATPAATAEGIRKQLDAVAVNLKFVSETGAVVLHLPAIEGTQAPEIGRVLSDRAKTMVERDVIAAILKRGRADPAVAEPGDPLDAEKLKAAARERWQAQSAWNRDARSFVERVDGIERRLDALYGIDEPADGTTARTLWAGLTDEPLAGDPAVAPFVGAMSGRCAALAAIVDLARAGAGDGPLADRLAARKGLIAKATARELPEQVRAAWAGLQALAGAAGAGTATAWPATTAELDDEGRVRDFLNRAYKRPALPDARRAQLAGELAAAGPATLKRFVDGLREPVAIDHAVRNELSDGRLAQFGVADRDAFLRTLDARVRFRAAVLRFRDEHRERPADEPAAQTADRVRRFRSAVAGLTSAPGAAHQFDAVFKQLDDLLAAPAPSAAPDPAPVAARPVKPLGERFQGLLDDPGIGPVVP